MTNQTEFSRLFRKYIDGNASAEELEAFLIIVDQSSQQKELEQLVDQEMLTQKQEYRLEPGEKQAILSHIYKLSGAQDHPVYPISKHRLWPLIAAAASIILCLSITAYLIFHKQPTLQTAQNQKQTIHPDGNK